MSESEIQKIYKCLLPKEQYQGEEKQQTQSGIEQLASQLSVAEQLMNAVGGLKVPKNNVFGKNDRLDQVSFELLAHNGKISFYIIIPSKLDGYIQQQLRSIYQHIEIEEVTDYNIFLPKGFVKGTHFILENSSYFPIKTYRHMESDPLESILGVLSRLGTQESAVIQLVARSAPKKWHEEGLKVAGKIKSGESLIKDPDRGLIFHVGKTLQAGIKSEKPGQKEEKKDTRLSPREEEMIKLIEDKNAKAGIEVTMRAIVTSSDEQSAEMHLDNITNSLSQYNIYEYGNSLKKSDDKLGKILSGFIHRDFNKKKSFVLNTEEMASIWHLPLASTNTPNIEWLASRRAPAPINLPEDGILIGKNIYRDQERDVRIRREDRRRHVYVIGTTGTGKSYFMYNMALQDVQNGEGVCVIDPHGDFVDYMLENIPSDRYDDVMLFNPADTDHPIGLNMLEATSEHEKDFVVQEMISIFYKLVSNPDMIGPLFEHNMRNAMLTLMADKDNPGTMAEIPRIFTDTDFQKELLKNVTDPVVRAFWEQEMAKTSDFQKSEMLGYLISKVGRFVENSMVRNIIGQTKSGVDFKSAMREGKIILVNLSKGLVGEINSSLLGLVIVSKIQMAAFSNAELPEHERKDFYLYIDEFQNYTTDSISTILSEARKYRLNLTMAHQYLGQLVQGADSSIKDSVLGNVGNVISFRIGVEDAPTIAAQMAPVFGEYDLINIEQRNAYAKILIDNTVQRAFSIRTIKGQVGDPQRKQLLTELSRRKYGRPKVEVEEEILRRSKLGQAIRQTSHDDIEKSL